MTSQQYLFHLKKMKEVDPVAPEGNLLFSAQKCLNALHFHFNLIIILQVIKKFEILSRSVHQIITLL